MLNKAFPTDKPERCPYVESLVKFNQSHINNQSYVSKTATRVGAFVYTPFLPY